MSLFRKQKLQLEEKGSCFLYGETEGEFMSFTLQLSPMALLIFRSIEAGIDYKTMLELMIAAEFSKENAESSLEKVLDICQLIW